MIVFCSLMPRHLRPGPEQLPELLTVCHLADQGRQDLRRFRGSFRELSGGVWGVGPGGSESAELSGEVWGVSPGGFEAQCC